MSLLSKTLGRVIPRYRTFSDWVTVYRQIIDARPIQPKTLQNRNASLRRLIDEFGPRTISAIRPHEVAQLLRRLHGQYPHLARRVLIEARDCFGEAVAYGWINTNPAASVRHQPTKVARRRLTLEEWQHIYAWSQANQRGWASRMILLALVTGQRRADLQKMRFEDVRDGYLYIQQQKKGARVRLPLDLRLEAIGVSLGEAIEQCRDYAPPGEYLLRKSTGERPVCPSLSARFEDAREGVYGKHSGAGLPPCLHECRSLSERLYRKQGIDTRTLLGHKRQSMTDTYNDDRGLSDGEWKTLEV